MNAEEFKKRFRQFRILSWVFTLVGLAMTVGGGYSFLFGKARAGVNIKTQLPTIGNGSLALVIGILFFLIGVYRLLNPVKSFHKEIGPENVEKENRRRRK